MTLAAHSGDSAPHHDGGPAFPWGEHGTLLGGMTIRDYFAAHASQGDVDKLVALVPTVAVVVKAGERMTIEYRSPDNARQIARYMHADAMLEARVQR